MTEERRLERLQRIYWRALILYVDLAESTFLTVSAIRGARSEKLPPSDRAKIEARRNEEDRAWQAYTKARNNFIAAALESSYEERTKVVGRPKVVPVDRMATPA